MEVRLSFGRRKPRSRPDYSGIPTHACPCGCTQFKILASFEDGEIAWYTTTGYCYSCGARVTVPTAVDHEAG